MAENNRQCNGFTRTKLLTGNNNTSECNHPWLAVARLCVQKLGGCKMVNEGVAFFVKINQQGIDSGSGWGLCWGSIKTKGKPPNI